MDQLPELQNDDICGYFDQLEEDTSVVNVGSDANLNTLWLNTALVSDSFNRMENCHEEYISDSESLGSAVSAVPSPAVFADAETTTKFSFLQDHELKQLSVKELNAKLKGQPKEVVRNIKRRRRTLKNRGYAHSCRVKRIEEKSCLLERKTEMEARISELQRQLDDVRAEKDFYKDRYEALVRHLVQLQNRRQ